MFGVPIQTVLGVVLLVGGLLWYGIPKVMSLSKSSETGVSTSYATKIKSLFTSAEQALFAIEIGLSIDQAGKFSEFMKDYTKNAK